MLLRLRVMDELRLESREDFHRLRHRKFAMRMLGMPWCEGALDLVARKFRQRTARRAWRQDRQIALINAETAALVATGGVEGNVHRSSMPCQQRLIRRIRSLQIKNRKEKKRTSASLQK